MILVSACLVGMNCRYNGGHKLRAELAQMVGQGRALPVCPEQLGGLPIPRPPAEIQGGAGGEVLAGEALVKDKRGADVTEAFLRGARETIKLARLAGAHVAILKEGSPSCGSCRVYDGSFSGKTRAGTGVTTALLKDGGLAVFSEENYRQFLTGLPPSPLQEGEKDRD